MLSIAFAIVWGIFTMYYGIPWISDIALIWGIPFAWFTVVGIALIPGVVMAFVNASLLLDRRPHYPKLKNQPDISILIAAHNEQDSIASTLKSILYQEYNGNINVFVMNDASTDDTSYEVHKVLNDIVWSNRLVLNKYNPNVKIELIEYKEKSGKAIVLNKGLDYVKTKYVITLDADSVLYKDALINIVTTIVNKDDDVAAVAGTILSDNTYKSLITKIQQWDYLHGIASVKRIQSMYQGTLVAQGAFSIYRTDVLREVCGWPDKIGEDIVLTWNIHNLGYKVTYDENAVCFTNVPETYKTFYKQRKRWARGLIEAFKVNSGLLFKPKKTTIFIWYNLLFPYIDTVFMFIFVPGVIAALFYSYYLFASIMTLYLLPLAFLSNMIIYFIQRKSLNKLQIEMPKKNWIGFILYILFFQLIMTPATLSGYVSELLKRKRVW